MRFTENGINIPENLISQREKGRVVFLCGAGISKKAGMPSFVDLTRKVLKQLDESEDSNSFQVFKMYWEYSSNELQNSLIDGIYKKLKEVNITQDATNIVHHFIEFQNAKELRKRIIFENFISTVVNVFKENNQNNKLSDFFSTLGSSNRSNIIQLDAIFEKMKKEFGEDKVYKCVAKLLKAKKVADISQHEIIKSISTNQDGIPQIVTTNFDLLFERGSPRNKLNIFEPNNFPNIDNGESIEGITYLHGRLKTVDSNEHSYILSQSDFAKSYMIDGRQTKFLRHLLKNYTVVLLGYSATDTLVRYLFQGLSSEINQNDTNLYVFGEKSKSEEEKWRDFGALLIGHDEGNFKQLWETLHEWSIMAKNFENWTETQLDKYAKISPSKLKPYNRGIVNFLAKDINGARLFNKIGATPEWLCVLDVYCRSKQIGDWKQYGITFKEEYRLDCDPSNEVRINKMAIEKQFEHTLHWVDEFNDEANSQENEEQKNNITSHKAMDHLFTWISNNLNSPITAWWAIRKFNLHHQLIQKIRWNLLRDSNLPQLAVRIWSYILEIQSNPTFTNDGFYVHEILDWAQKVGWIPSVCREFERNTNPRLIPNFHYVEYSNYPPVEDWSKIQLHELCRFDLVFPNYPYWQIEIPDHAITKIFKIIEHHLSKASEYLNEISGIYIKIPSCYPDKQIISNSENKNNSINSKELLDYYGRFHDNSCAKLCFWFKDLMIKLTTVNSNYLKSIIESWEPDEGFFILKFKLFGLNLKELFSANESIENLLNFDEQSFWNRENRRELLFLINERWAGLNRSNQKKIFERLLKGPDKEKWGTRSKFPDYSKKTAADYIYWLIDKNCKLTISQKQKFENLVDKLPKWSYKNALEVADENITQAFTVKRNDDPSSLVHLPVESAIEEIAKIDHNSFPFTDTINNPLVGLTRLHPEKLIEILKFDEFKWNIKADNWSTIIKNWPMEVNEKLVIEFMKCLCNLPIELIQELGLDLGTLIKEKIEKFYYIDSKLAWKLIDHIINSLSNDEKSLKNIEVFEGRYFTKKLSNRTYNSAINSPIGRITEGLMKLVSTQVTIKNGKLSTKLKLYFEKLTQTKADGSYHAVAILCFNINYLYDRDSKWVRDLMFPWFDFDSEFSEPAWNGLLSLCRVPNLEIRKRIKTQFSNLFQYLEEQNWQSGLNDLQNMAADIIILMAISQTNKADGVSKSEAQKYLKKMNEKTRNHVINFLQRVGIKNDNGWEKHVIPFIRTSWPKEKKFINSATVSNWINLLGDTSDYFPMVYNVVKMYIKKETLSSDCLIKFWHKFEDHEPLAVRYSSLVFDLLESAVGVITNGNRFGIVRTLELIEIENDELAMSRKFKRFKMWVHSC